MDQGIWATWYDLPESKSESFLRWAHADYLPFLCAVPGVAWVAHYANRGGGPTMQALLSDPERRGGDSVPTGCQYLLLVGAAYSYTFFDPWILDLELPSGFKDKLAIRKDLRTEIYAEEARVDGGHSDGRRWGSGPAPAIQFGTYNIDDVDGESMLGRWYSQQRLPMVSRLSACVRTRKLLASVGWAKHGVLYEFSSLEDRMREYEEPHESKTQDRQAWTGRITQTAKYPPGSPFVGERLWPLVDGR